MFCMKCVLCINISRPEAKEYGYITYWLISSRIANCCKRLPSHIGQEQACSRITWLFVRLFVCHHAKNGPIRRKMVIDYPLVITSKVKLFFRPDKTRKKKWMVQPVFCIVDAGSRFKLTATLTYGIQTRGISNQTWVFMNPHNNSILIFLVFLGIMNGGIMKVGIFDTPLRDCLGLGIIGESSLRQSPAYEFTKRAKDLENRLDNIEDFESWVKTFYCRLTILWLHYIWGPWWDHHLVKEIKGFFDLGHTLGLI